MKHLIISAALLLPLLATAQTQDMSTERPSEVTTVGHSTPLTLQQCLAVGLEKNYDLSIARRQEDIADNNATRGNAGFLPTLDLSSSYNGTLNDTRQERRDGGSVSSNGVNNNTLNAGLNLSWTAFNGFSVRTTYERLKELQDIGELNTRMTVENYIADLTSSYYDYINQTIRLKNMKRSIELSRERCRIAELSYSVGVVSRQEYQQAKLDLNADESKLIKQYENIHTIRTRLNELMGVGEIESPMMPADTTIVYDSSLKKVYVLENMLKDNVYLLVAESQKNVSGLDLKLAKSRSYPYLRVNSGYGYTQNWYGSGTNTQQRTLGLNYGVSLGVTLFDGMNQRRQVRNAEKETEISELSYQQTEQGLQKDLSDAWMAYDNNMRLVGMERRNVELAQDNYRITMENYKEGLLSGYELRVAQVSLLDAEERLVTAEYDTKLCEITLMQIGGQALSYLE